jgi:hypothetical protein
VVHASHENTVTRIEQLSPSVELKFDRTFKDYVEVDGVGMVHRVRLIRSVFNDRPLDLPGEEIILKEFRISLRARRRRNRGCGI